MIPVFDDCALLIIDMQEKLLSTLDDEIRAQLVRNVDILIELAKDTQSAIFYTEQNPAKLGGTIPELAAKLKDAIRVEKMSFSCMGEPDFCDKVCPHIPQSLIIVGKRKEIAKRLALLDDLQMENAALRLLVAENSLEFLPVNLINEMENYSYDVQDALMRLHSIAPPKLPGELKPAQTARLAELLAYVQLRMKMILEKARVNEATDRVSMNQLEWQTFVDLFSRLTDYYKQLTQPEN